MVTQQTRGVLFVHSAPRALCPHLEWGAGRALGRAVNFDWIEQPVQRGAQRTEYAWDGPVGTGAAIASARPSSVSACNGRPSSVEPAPVTRPRSRRRSSVE